MITYDEYIDPDEVLLIFEIDYLRKQENLPFMFGSYVMEIREALKNCPDYYKYVAYTTKGVKIIIGLETPDMISKVNIEAYYNDYN